MKVSRTQLERYMQIALDEAARAAQQGEVPVGAAVVRRDEVLSQAGNMIEGRRDATAHAEMLAIQAASERLGNWRLADCILCVTVEPCTMCTGAILQARIPVVAFGAFEPRYGALGSCYDLSQNEDVNLKVVAGIKEVEARSLLQRFFQQQR